MDERRWQMAAWVVAAIVATVIAVRLLSDADPAPPPVQLDAQRAPERGEESRSAQPKLFVHVAGAVRRPGLYRLAAGGRVAVAIDRAGGPLDAADMTGVNLAAPLQDGQQVVVPFRSSTGAAAASEAPPSLGSASVEQLEELDGIGPTLAERIVEHRTASGGFASLDELREVEGIGEKRLEALKEALSP